MDTYTLMELAFTSPGALAELATHDDWRVRYAAALAMGETHDPAWLPALTTMFAREEQRALYTQPPAHFSQAGGLPQIDDTRIAEMIGPLNFSFDDEPAPEMLEDWRCRGRVKQAILYAVYEIGEAGEELLALIHPILTRVQEDYPVRAAAARALGRVGTAASRASLHAAESIDEWCTQTEARKALKRLEHA